MTGEPENPRNERGTTGGQRWRKRSRRRAALIGTSVASLTAFGMMAGMGEASELPLRRVVLSNIGLAQFTHAGSITPGGSVDLSVRLDQVDDLLKSLTVFDREGAIGAVSLPGKAPLTELFRDLPFGPDALNSPAALLNALVGTEVEVTGPVVAKGRVLRVTQEKAVLPANTGTVVRHRLSLMTEKGIVQAVLEDATSLRFTDPVAKAQIDRALAGLTENRAKDRRRLSLSMLGSNPRNIAISYVVSAPVWKTSYRLVVPKAGDKARLQGWAVVENLTGGDWTDVELVLVSGNPVALRQPLYTAFFAQRPEIPVITGQHVVPRTDDQPAGGMLGNVRPPSPKYARRARGSGQQLQRQMAAAPPPPMAYAAPEPATMAAPALAAEAEEAATQLLYRFPARISLATGHTMMVTFLDREVAATRTWLYQPDTHARRPLAAVRLRNDGESGLPAGIVTAFERSGDGSTNFVGDAQLPLLPKGAVKFVTLALDTKTDIRREDLGIKRTTLGTAVDGELSITTRSRHTLRYEITPPVDEDREILIEETRAAGWAPAAEMRDVERTPTRFRYKVLAPKGTTTSSQLVLDRVDRRTVHLASLAAEQILATVRGLENEGPALRNAIAALSRVIGEINRAQGEQARLEAERKRIGEDQQRIRQNLESVGAGSDLGRRYLDQLKGQEDRLAEIARRDQQLDGEIAAKHKQAAEVARQLKL